MMAAPTAPTTPDLMDVLTDAPPTTYGVAAPELGAVTLEVLLDAVDERLETAPADIALELIRGRRALEVELARLLEA
jgi:hypothetical protein